MYICIVIQCEQIIINARALCSVTAVPAVALLPYYLIVATSTIAAAAGVCVCFTLFICRAARLQCSAVRQLFSVVVPQIQIQQQQI